MCYLVKRFKQFSSFFLGEEVGFCVEGLTEDSVTGSVRSNGDSSSRVPAIALLPNTAGVDCTTLGNVHRAIVTAVDLEACQLEVSLSPWLLNNVKQRREGGFASRSMQVCVVIFSITFLRHWDHH